MDELLRFLESTLKTDFTLQASTPLLSSGIIDSMKFTALLAALEQRYGVQIEPSDVGADNFDTVEQILHFVQGHCSS